MKKTCICIICPNGCEIEAEVKEDGTLSLTGNTCDKGADYVRQELTAPVQSGTVILRKVCGLDSDVVATRTVRAVNESQSL